MTANAKKQFGGKGEQIAQDYLRSQGYTILTTNWRCSYGEIDIVAQHDETVVFVEVRSRHDVNTETAFESITPRKQKRMAAAAQAYLDAHQLNDPLWRVDIIAVAVSHAGESVIDHLQDGLAWD